MKTVGINIRTVLLCAFLVWTALVPSHSAAQEKTVSGTIRGKAGKPIDRSSVSLSVFAFNTVAQAEDVVAMLRSNPNAIVTTHNSQAYPDETCYYEIKVAPTGALVFVADFAEPILEKVNGRMQINVSLDVGLHISEAVITEEREVVAVLEPKSEMVGDTLVVSGGLAIPRFTGKTDSRLIIQPVLLDRLTKDTLQYLAPMVVDGEEYSMTQKSRLNYDASRDPLTKYVNPSATLTEDKLVVPWNAKICVPDPSKDYMVLGLLRMEDYNRPFFVKEEYLASIRTRRPVRFLRYDIRPMDLNSDDYYVAPHREKLNSTGSISLNFEQNKSVISASDVVGRSQLDSLKRVLLDIVNGEGTYLQEFHVEGSASPEGLYSKNVRLAKDRTDFALKEIMSVLPKYVRDRVWNSSKSVVRSWSEVADLIEIDDASRAGEIREIIAGYPDDVDAQGREIQRLEYYKDILDNYLPKLRSVRYTISYEVNRALTPDEILKRWSTDPDYRSGRRNFTLHEFWQLFRMVKDESELDTLYRLAYNQTKLSQGKPWELAAGKLSAALLNKGRIDTSILAPFIDYTVKNCDVSLLRKDGSGRDIVNPHALVYNQLVTCLKSQDFSRSSQLSQMLSDTEEMRVVKSLAMCLGGYYKGGDTPEEREKINGYFQTVCNTSIWNKVVLCLARGISEKVFNDEALSTIELLPEDEPMRYYFKAIALSRRGYDYLLESEGNLYKACKMKPELLEIAAGDGDIREDSVEEVRKALQDPANGDLIYGFY